MAKAIETCMNCCVHSVWSPDYAYAFDHARIHCCHFFDPGKGLRPVPAQQVFKRPSADVIQIFLGRCAGYQCLDAAPRLRRLVFKKLRQQTGGAAVDRWLGPPFVEPVLNECSVAHARHWFPWGLTFELSRVWRLAKPAGARRLQRGVRRCDELRKTETLRLMRQCIESHGGEVKTVRWPPKDGRPKPRWKHRQPEGGLVRPRRQERK
jgi:hypothetical protein